METCRFGRVTITPETQWTNCTNSESKQLDSMTNSKEEKEIF